MSFEGAGGGEVVEQGTQVQGGAEGAPAAGEQQGQQGGGEDQFAKLFSSMENFQKTMTERIGAFEQRLPPAVEAAVEEDDSFDLAALLEGLPEDAFDDESGTITPEGQMELMRQMARQEADRVRSEAQQARIEAEHTAYADGLEQKYTELRDPQKQQQVLAEASRLAQQMGQPALAGNPYFFEQTYLSMAGRSHAAAEVPAQNADPGVRLEQPGGGGGPVDNGNGPSTQQRIVGAARGGAFRLGSG